QPRDPEPAPPLAELERNAPTSAGEVGSMTPEDEKLEQELIARLSRLPAPAPPAPEVQSEVRRRVLMEYDRSAARRTLAGSWRVLQQGVLIMSHPASRVIAAAAALVFLAYWLAMPQRSVAFGDFLAPIVDAKSARFTCTIKDDIQKKEIVAKAFFLAP